LGITYPFFLEYLKAVNDEEVNRYERGSRRSQKFE
jgi:hypothetical protein